MTSTTTDGRAARTRRHSRNSRITRLPSRLIRWVDGDHPVFPGLAQTFRQAFPRRWSHLFGHVALFSFVLIVISGLFLTLWYKPSMEVVTYTGAHGPLRGVEMSAAFASTLEMSFEVRGGLLVRQIHVWATHLFIASLSLHLVQLFFTGAFRRPRRLRWLLVLALLVVGMAEAYLGHALPDDLLSGTGLRVAEGVILAIPVVGTYLSSLLFGGEFPGDDIIARLNSVHVVWLPALMIALFAALVIHTRHQRRTHRPDAARKRGSGDGGGGGASVVPDHPVRAVGLLALVVGVIVLLAATVQVNPVWLWGPFDSAVAAAGSQPPWYFGFLDGGLRLMPGWDVDLLGHELTLSVLVPALVVPGIMLVLVAGYPWIEQAATGRADPDRLDRPRDMPVRTGLGAAFITFYLVLWIAGGNDVIATVVQVPVNWITRFLQVALIVLPPVVFWVTKRVCLGLRRRDVDVVRHGRETGVIVADRNGAFSEVRAPLASADTERRAPARRTVAFVPGPAEDAHGVRNPNRRVERLRGRLARFFFADVEQTATYATPIADEATAHERPDPAVEAPETRSPRPTAR